MIVSFIIPAFNASQTIIRCLDSIYSLPMKEDEYEVIVIDDCSTDNTAEMVEQYALQHLNLTLLRQVQNHRQGAARNRGLTIANGKFICFVDSDDTVANGIVTALQIGINKKLDMVAMHYMNCDEQGNRQQEANILKWGKDEIFTGIDLQLNYAYWCSAPWGYAYNTTFLRSINYPFTEDVLYEDADFVMWHLYNAKRICYSSECAYNVYANPQSTIHTLSYKHLADYLLLGTRQLVFYSKIQNDLHVCEYSEKERYNVENFSQSILEGGCYNICKSFRKLIRLDSINEIDAFYNRIDEHINRRELLSNRDIRKYYWHFWTWLCLRQRKIATLMISLFIKIK